MTSSTECQDIVSKYLEYMSGDFAVEPTQGGCFILTPFVRPDGEAIELELTALPNGVTRLSDMGDTLGYLYVNGLSLTRSVIDKARRISRRHGAAFLRNSLVMDSDSALTGEDIHRLIQATLEVTALIQGRRSTGQVLFDTEVESFIIQSGVVYDADFRVSGQRESHTFKFHINSTRNLLVQPITAATESAAHSWAERWAYRFSDSIAVNEHLRPIAVLDDRGNRSGVWTERVRAPIQEIAIPWAEKDRLATIFAT